MYNLFIKGDYLKMKVNNIIFFKLNKNQDIHSKANKAYFCQYIK